MARGTLARKSLYKVMEEAQLQGQQVFRKSSFEEQMLATALGNLCTQDVSAGISSFVQSLELVMDVYISNLEKNHFKQEESFSMAQMQVIKYSHEIAQKLMASQQQLIRKDEKLVIRSLLVLAIITGDIQFLLDVASGNWMSHTKADVSDLLATLIVIAKRIYLLNAPKKSADQNSAICGLNSAHQRVFKIADSVKKLVANWNLLWDGKYIFAIDETLRLCKLNGRAGSIHFGSVIESIQLKQMPKSMMLVQDSTKNEGQLHVIQEKYSFGTLQRMVLYLDNWEALFTTVIERVNREILPNNFRLIDIGFTAQPKPEGEKKVAWLIYDKTNLDFSGKNKELKVIKRYADEPWVNSFNWMNEQIKTVSNRYFKHSYSAAEQDKNDYQWLAVWHWSKPQRQTTPDDIQLEFVREWAWADVVKKTNNLCNQPGRRIIDVKCAGVAAGGDGLATVVSVKDPRYQAYVGIDFQKYKGTYDSVAMQISAKVKKGDPKKFVGISICPRDTTQNDEKVTFYVTQTPFQQSSEKKLTSLQQTVIAAPQLEACIDSVTEFVNKGLREVRGMPVDLGFAVKSQGEGDGRPLGWVVFNEEQHAFTNQKLAVITTRTDVSWEECFAWLQQKIKEAGNRFFKHAYAPAAFNSESKVLAVWYWEDVELKETDVQLDFIDTFYWDDCVSKITSLCIDKMKGRRVIDTKVSSRENGGNALATVVSIADPKVQGIVVLGRENHAGNHDEVLTQLRGKMSDTYVEQFAGISMCPRDTNVNDNKVTICARFYCSKTDGDLQIKKVYSVESLSVCKESNIKQVNVLAESKPVKIEDKLAFIGLQNDKLVAIYDQGKPIQLSTPLKLVNLMNVNYSEGLLFVTFETHIVTYSTKDLESGLEVAKPIGFKEINTENAANIVFKQGSAEFFFLHKKEAQAVGFDCLDDLLDPVHDLDRNQPSHLVGFSRQVQNQCRRAQAGLHLIKERESFDEFKSVFKGEKSKEQKTEEIGVNDLRAYLLNLVTQFASMQQYKVLESRLEAISLLKSPYTLSQTSKVRKALMGLTNSPSLDLAFYATTLLIDHLVALRQNGDTLKELQAGDLNPDTLATDLLRLLIGLDTKIQEVDQVHRKNRLERRFDEVFDKFISLLKESILFSREQQPAQMTQPALLVITKADLEQVAFTARIPRHRLIAHLLDASLPIGVAVTDFDDELKEFIVSHFQVKQGTDSHETAVHFVMHFASLATKTKDERSLRHILQLFDAALKTQIGNPQEFGTDTVCGHTLVVTSYLIWIIDRGDLTKVAVQKFKQMTGQMKNDQLISSGSASQFLGIGAFKLFANVLCMQSRELLMAEPEKLPKLSQDLDEHRVIVELINKSDLLSGGLEKQYMNLCSAQTLEQIKQLQRFTNIQLLDAIQNSDQELSEGCKVCNAIISEGSHQRVDEIVRALQQIILKQPALRVSAQTGGALGFKLTRCAFAVMLKFSGLLPSFQGLIEMLNMEEDSMMIPKEKPARDQAILEIVQEDQIAPKLIKLWTLSTKMRFWLQQVKKLNADEIEKRFPMKDVNLTDEDKLLLSAEEIAEKERDLSEQESERVREMRDKEEVAMLERGAAQIEEKALFLIKLETPECFKTLEPDQEQQYQTTFLNYPSYYEMQSQGSSDLSKHQSHDSSQQPGWRRKFSEWKSMFVEQGKFRSKQEKLSEIKESGTTSVLACLQTNITAASIQERVELNFTNAARRLAGLSLLDTFLEFLTSVEGTDSHILQVISCLCSSLQVSRDRLFHYLDDVSGCGNFLEGALRSTFFSILQQLMKHAERKNSMPRELIPCFQWNYKARDFQFLIKLRMLKKLMWGCDANGIYSHFGVNQQLSLKDIDPVVKAHLFNPNGELAKSLLFTFVDLNLAIMARLAEESDKREHFGISGGSSQIMIQKSMSVVDTSECQLLLSQAFDIVFREFELFLDVSKEFNCLEQLPRIEFTDSSKYMEQIMNAINRRKYAERNPIQTEVITTEAQVIQTSQVETEPEIQPIQPNKAHEESEMFGALFGDRELQNSKEVPKQKEPVVLEMNLDVKRKKIQDLANSFRTEMKKKRMQSLMSLIVIFVNIATSSAYPLQLMQNVANPVHIQTLLKLFLEVTPLMKIQILHILKNLLLIQIPAEVFSTGLKGIQSDFKTQFVFKNALAQLLYQHAVQLRSGKWNSVFESKSGGLYDVFVHTTRTIALCLKQDQIRLKTNENTELSAAFEAIHAYSTEERDVLFHIVGAHHQRFVHKDRALNVSQQKITRFDRSKPSNQSEEVYVSYIVCPEKNDAHLQLVLTKQAILSLITKLMDKKPIEESKEPDLECSIFKGHILKLLCLQYHSEETKFDTVLDESQRQAFLRYLLEEGEGSLQDMSSSQLQPQNAATLKTVRYLEFALNRSETQGIDFYIKEQKKQPQVVQSNEGPVEIESIFGEAQPDVKKEFLAPVTKSKAKTAKKHPMKTDKVVKSAAKQVPTEKSAMKRALVNSIFSKLQGVAMKTEEDISMLTTKVCDFMDLTGITLHEIVFGLCLADDLSVDALEKRKEAYIVKLEAICEQIEKEEKVGIPDASNAFREEQALASYLLEKLQSTFTYMVNEELDAKLASIDIAKVRALFGPEVAERQIKVKQSIFRRLADVYSNNFDNAITSVLDTEMKTEDAASAQKLFSKKQKSMEEIDKFLKETGLIDIAEALKKQLAAKLLFEIVDPAIDLKTSASVCDSQLPANMKLITVLLSHYAKVCSELQKNHSVGCIWECRFKPHIQKQLALSRLQTQGEEAEKLELFEGSEQNIHQVLASVTYPTVDSIRSRILTIMQGLQQSVTGAELVRRLVQSQIIDKCVFNCLKHKQYLKAHQACFDALRPLKIAEDAAKVSASQDQDFTEVEDILEGVWFMYGPEDTHHRSFDLKPDHSVAIKEEKAGPAKNTTGKWSVLTINTFEIVAGKDRYVFDSDDHQNKWICLTHAFTFIKKIMHPSQLVGEWSWCHDGVNRECELILNDRRGGQSGGSPNTYWYIQPDHKIFIGRLNQDDRHIFKIVDDNTLEIVEPQRNPPTRCLRVTPVPQKIKPALVPEQLPGKWHWQHDGETNSHPEPHILYVNGSIMSDGPAKGEWRMEPDGMVYIGRTNPQDRHICKIIDKNTLEVIEPKRNPPTRMRRADECPPNPYQKDKDRLLNISSQQMQTNSLVISLLLATPDDKLNFWTDILPQLFEMLLFSLSFKPSPAKVRLIFEQCQLILHFAIEKANILVRSGLLQTLMQSPLLERCLAISNKHRDDSNSKLFKLLLADMKVQQQEAFDQVDKELAQQVNLTGPRRTYLVENALTLQSLRKQFGTDNYDCLEVKKHFLKEYWSVLPQVACFDKKVTLSSNEETKSAQDTIDLSSMQSFSDIVIKSLPETAKGNPDVVMHVQYGNGGTYANLREPVNIETRTNKMTVNFDCLSKKYLRAVYPKWSENDMRQNAFKNATMQGQLLQSLKVDIDAMITSTEIGVFYWCANYTKIYKSSGEMCFPVTLPTKLKEALEQPRDENWKHPKIKIQVYFDQQLFLLNGEVLCVENSENQKFDFGNEQITDFCASKKTALFITQKGEMYESGLKNLADNSGEGKFVVTKITFPLFPELIEDSKFSRCWIQANQPANAGDQTGYVIVETILQKAQQVKLYSFGINANGCLGNGLDISKKTDAFTPVLDVFQDTCLDKFFLSPNMAIAFDIFGAMWILGGRAGFKDNVYFPGNLSEVSNFPLKTQLMDHFQAQFGQKTLLQIKRVEASNDMMLLLFEANSLSDQRIFKICYQVVSSIGNAERCDINLLSYIDQSVVDIACYQGKGILLVERADTFGRDYSIDFEITPNFEKSITTENAEGILSEVMPQWNQFKASFHSAFDTQLVFDVLDCINTNLAQANANNIDANFFKQINQKEIKLKGEMFTTEEDQRLGRVMVHKLICINMQHAVMFDKKMDVTFGADPFAFISPGLGLAQSCRNWANILKSKKRFLVDKFLESQFNKILEKLPKDDRGRIEITINRYAARRFCDSGQVDTGDGNTVFMQVMRVLKKDDPKFTAWRKNGLNAAVWRANFLHEGSIDAGGPYRECHEQMCTEVLSGALPLLIPTENQIHGVGEMRECFILNHNSISEKELEQFFMMGLWIGNAIRQGAPLNLTLHPTVWKRLVGQDDFALRDLKYIDMHSYSELMTIKDTAAMCQSESDFTDSIDLCFTVTFGGGENKRTVELCPGGYSKQVTLANHEEYVRLAANALIKKDELQMNEFKRGVYHVLSKQALNCCSWKFVVDRACGKQTIDMELLKKHSSFSSSLKNKKVSDKPYEEVFWKILSEFSENDKQLYLKFVTGRAKMPLNIASQSYQHTVTSMGGNNATLPQAHICYNQIDMPPYTNEGDMRKRLLTAIQFCGEVDTDGVRHADY